MKETLRGLSSRFYNNHYAMIMLYQQNLDPLDVSKVFTRQRSSRKNARILICSTKCIDGQIERRANIGNLFTDCAVFCFFLVNGLILRRFFFGLTQFVYGSNRTVFLTNQQINQNMPKNASKIQCSKPSCRQFDPGAFHLKFFSLQNFYEE